MFRKKQKEIIKQSVDIIDDASPFAFTESYKSLRTNLEFMTFSGEVKVISITSTIPNEGKSSVSINLATTLAQSGKKVLIIDADLRAPSIQRYLNIRHAGAGLSSILSGQIDVKDAIYTYKPLGFSVILSGPIPPNPSELLMRPVLQTVLDELKPHYDYIILDTSPTGVITDARIISNYTDGTLYVVRHQYAERNRIKAAVDQLKANDTKILGVIMNNYEVSSSNDAYGTTYGYGYGEK